MLKALVTYYELAVKAVETDGSISWMKLREATNDEWFRLTQMKFEDPANGEGASILLLPYPCALY
jgi:V-type H+-transporting ATPase subunit A